MIKKVKKINGKKVWLEIQHGIIDKTTKKAGSIVTGDCEICCSFPCKHINMNNWTIENIKE